MAKSYPPRPANDFRITTFAWHLSSELNHRNAGFPAIPQETLVRRFWQFIFFLQDHGFTTLEIVHGPADITPDSELRNRDLTGEGYRFVQRYCDRWTGRMHKDRGEVSEAKLLGKWLGEFRTSSVEA